MDEELQLIEQRLNEEKEKQRKMEIAALEAEEVRRKNRERAESFYKKGVEGLKQTYVEPLKQAGTLLSGQAQTSEQIGQGIKGITNLPLNIITAPAAVPASFALGGSGATEAIGKGMSALPQPIQKPVATVAEILGAIGAKGTKVPFKSKIDVNVTPLSKGLKTGVATTAGRTGAKIVIGAESAMDDVIKNIYEPMRKELAQQKGSIVMGKQTAKDIVNHFDTLRGQAKISPKEAKEFLKVAQEISKEGNTLDKLLNMRQRYDREFKAMFKDNPDFAQAQAKVVRDIITKNIEKQLEKNPQALENFRNSNKAYSAMKNALEPISKSKALSVSDEQIFTRYILNKGTDAIERVQKGVGKDLIEEATFNYIAENVFDPSGNFIGTKYKSVISKIGEDRGSLIFGSETWRDLKDFIKVIDDIEGQGKIIETAKQGVEPLRRISKFMQSNRFNKIVEKGGKYKSGLLTNRRDMIIDAIVGTGYAVSKTPSQEQRKERAKKITESIKGRKK